MNLSLLYIFINKSNENLLCWKTYFVGNNYLNLVLGGLQDLLKLMEVSWLLSRNNLEVNSFIDLYLLLNFLGVSIHDLELMQALHTYLGVGRLVINRERVSIVVTSLKEIITVILPHFEKYPVESLYLI